MPSNANIPQLNVYPRSGLSFAWTFWEGPRGGLESIEEAHLGPDGCGAGLEIVIFWEDLFDALPQLLGFSYRKGPAQLGRILPWQHPYFNQLFVKSITRVRGLQMNGSVIWDSVLPGGGSAGIGWRPNLGPANTFTYASLTLQFWRPTYYLKTDDDIEAYSSFFGGRPAEWLRYVDRDWKIEPQMLTRDSGGSVVWGNKNPCGSQSTYTAAPQGQGGVVTSNRLGTKISHLKLSRVWHEIPAQCLFTLDVDGSPSGIPYPLLYTQTGPIINPFTGFPYPAVSPINGCVNITIGGNIALEVNPDFQLFGSPCGTLLYEGGEIVEKPLQLPPSLMGILPIAGNWPLAQTQYDVILHFDYFDPPVDLEVNTFSALNNFGQCILFTAYGHNLAPYPGDNLWYVQTSQLGPGGVNNPPYRSLFDYADLTDLFSTL